MGNFNFAFCGIHSDDFNYSEVSLAITTLIRLGRTVSITCLSYKFQKSECEDGEANLLPRGILHQQ